MTTPLWVLLGFAAWTLAVLLGTVGVYRWSNILVRGAGLTEFPGDRPHGASWYRRAMRAHANCVENLPVYTALVVVAVAAGVDNAILDVAAMTLLAARIGQSLTHILFRETGVTVGVRFSFFLVQVVCLIVMGVNIAESV